MRTKQAWIAPTIIEGALSDGMMEILCRLAIQADSEQWLRELFYGNPDAPKPRGILNFRGEPD